MLQAELGKESLREQPGRACVVFRPPLSHARRHVSVCVSSFECVNARRQKNLSVPSPRYLIECVCIHVRVFIPTDLNPDP